MPKLSQLAQTLEFGKCSPKVQERLERRQAAMLREFERVSFRKAKRFERQQAWDE